MARVYKQTKIKFDPFKNIYIGIDSIIKICSNIGCTESRKSLCYENWSKDSQRPYGYQSQCRECKRIYTRAYMKVGYAEFKELQKLEPTLTWEKLNVKKP